MGGIKDRFRRGWRSISGG